MKRILEFVVRFRTWVVNLALAILVVAPDLLNAPQVLAVIPAEWHSKVLAVAFLLNIWMRPRPAVIASDPEVQMKKAAQ